MIQHKCHLSDSDLGQYAVMKIDQPTKKTRLHCQACGEFFFIEGHEMFEEMTPTRLSSYKMPPGFVVARTKID